MAQTSKQRAYVRASSVFACVGAFLITFFWFEVASTQKKSDSLPQKIDLEDVKIRGESNKAGNLLNQRNKTNLDDRIKIPKDFRSAIIENLPENLNGISDLEPK